MHFTIDKTNDDTLSKSFFITQFDINSDREGFLKYIKSFIKILNNLFNRGPRKTIV